MSIETDTPRDWIKPLSILCPGDLNFEFHVEGCGLSRGELALGGRQTKGEYAQPSAKMSSSCFVTGQDSFRLNPTLFQFRALTLGGRVADGWEVGGNWAGVRTPENFLP